MVFSFSHTRVALRPLLNLNFKNSVVPVFISNISSAPSEIGRYVSKNVSRNWRCEISDDTFFVWTMYVILSRRLSNTVLPDF